MSSHVCTLDSLHPWECGGNCIHCQRKVTDKHDPLQCWLCHETADPHGPDSCLLCQETERQLAADAAGKTVYRTHSDTELVP